MKGRFQLDHDAPQTKNITIGPKLPSDPQRDKPEPLFVVAARRLQDRHEALWKAEQGDVSSDLEGVEKQFGERTGVEPDALIGRLQPS